MTFNIAVQQEQEQRLQNDLVAVEMQIDASTVRYQVGLCDAILGKEPEITGWKFDLSYRNGWLAGIAERYDEQIGTAYNEPF